MTNDQTQFQMLQQQVQQLTTQYQQLYTAIFGQSNADNFNELIRDIVFFDQDTSTTTTTTTIYTDSRGDTVSVTAPKNPDQYIRIYFRGRVFNVPVLKIS